MKNKIKNELFVEDYDEKFLYKDLKNKINISFNRIAFIFFVFVALGIIFSIKASIGEWQSSVGEYLNLKTIYAPYTLSLIHI